MAQFSPRTDRQLQGYSDIIKEADETIEKATADRTKAFSDAFDAWDELGYQDQGVRFVSANGFVLERRKSNPSSKLDQKKLRNEIVTRHPQDAAQIIRQITNPTFDEMTREQLLDYIYESMPIDEKRLEQATLIGITIRSGGKRKHMKLSADMVADCIETPAATFSRYHQPWTKDDKAKAQELGFAEKP